MKYVLEFGILGLATGGSYGLLALGIIVVFRTSGVVNFAEAAFAVAAGFLVVNLEGHGLGIVPAIAISVVAGAIVGALVELIVMRQLKESSVLTKTVATLGILIVLQAICQLVFGSLPVVLPQFLPSSTVSIGPATVSVANIIIFAVALVLTLLLWVFYRFSTFGLNATAVAENEIAAQAIGISCSLVRLVNWSIAGALSAFAGILIAPESGVSLSNMSDGLLLPALGAALLGGFTSFPMALTGALAIGITESELTYWGHSGPLSALPDLPQAVPLLIIIIALTARGSVLPTRGFFRERLPRIGSGKIKPVNLVIGAVGLVLVESLAPSAWILPVTSTFIVAVFLLSFVVLTGYAGQLSLGQLGLGGVGALIAAQLVGAAHWPGPAAVIVGVCVGIPIGLLVGLPALRVRGLNLAIVTLAVAAALADLVYNTNNLTGGSTGIHVGFPEVLGLQIDETNSPVRYSVTAIIVFVVIAFMVRNLRRSQIGRRLLAVRSNERAAASVGINVIGVKLYAFVIAEVIATWGALLIVFRYPNALFSTFDAFSNITYAIEAVVGGVGFIAGAIAGAMIDASSLGAKLFTVMGIGQWIVFVGGILLLFTVLMNPDGIASTFAGFRSGRKRRKTGLVAEVARENSGVDLTPPDASRKNPCRLTIEGVSVRFGAVEALRNVSLELTGGQVLGVIGPNGAGKTTLIDALTGYTRYTGRISLDGEDLVGLSPFRRSRKEIARCFQSLELLEDLTVEENLEVAAFRPNPVDWFTCLFRPRSKTVGVSVQQRVDWALARIGLLDFRSMLPSDLSLGERRLVAVARAVVSSPKLLILDEPAAGLSGTERDELVQLIRTMSESLAIAVLVVEHDVDLIMRAADQLVVLDQGAVIASGDPETVRSDEKVIDAYLGRKARAAAQEVDSV